ncbi:DNA methyltransferase (fragment) [Nitrolancea hollandica Lb]|uniref:site-specific DNA-methyltransferase (adenine-specific) n=1 Tax=Nitrolancea hollandica Lb TaxID=1129897 RepID=I4EDU3_9BACT
MPVSQLDSVQSALRAFAQEVKATTDQANQIDFQPEDQLKRSVPKLIKRVGATLGISVSVFSESPVDEIGRPDLAIAVDRLLVGYVELKAPGVGTTNRELRGHNRTQLKKFLTLPNLIYTDARDWTFYREGEHKRSYDVRLGDIDETGATELAESDARKLLDLLREFLHWQPIVATSARGLAEQLAPLTRMLRKDVESAVRAQKPALSGIYADWKRTLFPQAKPDEFADSYAQTLTYGLLLAKLSGATTLDTTSAAQAIRHHSSLLARTLEILTQPGTREELGTGLELLERTIEAVDSTAIRGRDDEDPWLYFYEDFLAVYDPDLRKKRGVYYTSVQVVKAQVTLVDELLRTRLNRTLGFADPDVTVLDPATGTGTYLLRVLQHGVDHGTRVYGLGAAGDIASQLARNLYGFELLVGPYAVAHLRLAQAIQEAGGHEPDDGVHIYLTDTLESPNEIKKLPHSFYERPLAEEHRRAREVKRKTPILVCIGNPPYDREESESVDGRIAGSWIRFGDQATKKAPLDTFVEPAQRAGAGLHIKNLYNLYVYFWRWALWKVFETQDGPGIVSFITAASYLRGPGFVGMREELRRTFDDLWILDLEGDSRGTRKTDNVFDIQTPVAIAVGVRYGTPNRNRPADVHYARITGTQAEKLTVLSELSGFRHLLWEPGQIDWRQPLTAASAGDYFSWPSLVDMMPWQHSGTQLKRLWPIGENREVLLRRWSILLTAPNRAVYFRETRDRQVSKEYPDQLGERGVLPAIASLPRDAEPPEIVRYGYRSFDRQYVFRDTRVGDFYRPPLWRIVSEEQIFLTTLLEHSLGIGTAFTATVFVPDLHLFPRELRRERCHAPIPGCDGERAEHHRWAARFTRRDLRVHRHSRGPNRVYCRDAGASGLHRTLP